MTNVEYIKHMLRTWYPRGYHVQTCAL